MLILDAPRSAKKILEYDFYLGEKQKPIKGITSPKKEAYQEEKQKSLSPRSKKFQAQFRLRESWAVWVGNDPFRANLSIARKVTAKKFVLPARHGGGSLQP